MEVNKVPLISVIIPCYNYGHFLHAALLSVEEQTMDNWECLVIDDGSTDNTGEVALQFTQKDNRFRYTWQNNSGLSTARNTGINQARGSLLQFLDADDLIAPQKLAIQSACLDTHPADDIVYGNAYRFTAGADGQPVITEKKQQQQELRSSGSGTLIVKNLCINNFMEVSCALVRRSTIERVGLFDTTYTSYEDWQYWFRCALAGAGFRYLPEAGTETLIRTGHASMMSHRARMNENGRRIRQYMMPYLPGTLRGYNRYRLLKLWLKKIWLYK